MQWNYHLVAFLKARFGLAVAARNTLMVLEHSGRRVETTDIEMRLWRRATRARRNAKRPVASALRAINLFQLNPLELAVFSRQWKPLVAPHAPHVCVPFWELPLVPTSWESILDAMDFVLAPTRFIESACAAVLGPRRVLHYPQAVFIPPNVHASREHWSLPPRATVFAVSFDIGSDIERKNPWAAVDAFRLAFPSDPDVRLIIKTKPCPNVPKLRALVAKLNARVGGDTRIRIIDAELPYDEVLSLYASCDALISLHRSEGLGLHLMEAMSLGLVVVATNWSGCTDFLTAENSIPIGHELVPIAPAHEAYAAEVGRPGQIWAEPHIGEAADALRAVHADRAARIARGQRASMEMATRREAMLRGSTFDALEARLMTAPPVGSRLSSAVRSTATALHARLVRDTVRSIPRRIWSAFRTR